LEFVDDWRDLASTMGMYDPSDSDEAWADLCEEYCKNIEAVAMNLQTAITAFIEQKGDVEIKMRPIIQRNLEEMLKGT
jgi:hypothetical protein